MGLPIQFVLVRALFFGVALTCSLPDAAAAPARRHKPSRAAGKVAKSVQKAEAPAPAEVTLEPAAPAPSPSAPPASAAESPTTPAPSLPAAAPSAPPSAPLADPTSSRAGITSDARGAEHGHGDGEADAEVEALGRREAARLASGRIAVAVWASVDLGRRQFKYSDPIGTLLAPYQLPIAPMASFGLEAYPFASTGLPVLRDLGFRGRLSRAFGIDSTTPDGDAIETSWTRFGGELRQRVLFPGQPGLELGVAAGLDASYFGMKTKRELMALLPSARAVALRFGVDARFRAFRSFSLLAGGAYLVSTSASEIYQQFRQPHVAGVDAELGFALGLSPELEARLTGRYTRYFASFRPVPGDHVVAGGALDEQMQLGLGVRYAH